MDDNLFLRQTDQWRSASVGKSLLRLENKYLAELLPQLLGYYLLQIGGIADFSYALHSNATCNIYLNSDTTNPAFTQAAEYFSVVCGSEEALPFAYDAIDIVILPHILEFAANPRLILEETYHVLAPGGKLIILAFNSNSTIGIERIFHAKSKQPFPWGGRFVSAWRIRNWLVELGFAVNDYKTFGFGLSKLGCGVAILEKMGTLLCPFFGNVCAFIAEKQTAVLMPEREHQVDRKGRVVWCPKPSAMT